MRAAQEQNRLPYESKTVIQYCLVVFKNRGYMQTVTIAQVFWQKELQGQPDRFFVVADCDLSISQDFSNFGTDIKNLKKKLKQLKGVDDIYESFPPYSAAFKRRFGIQNEQAMELFHQTVSLKSVGNLTEFVRTHMLEAFDSESRISALITHFDDLNRAHDSVLKAKRQIERLQPLVTDLDNYAQFTQIANDLRTCRNALSYFFATIKQGLLQKRLGNYQDEHQRISGRIEQIKEQYSQQQSERDKLRQAIAENGGDRLERLKNDIIQLMDKKSSRLQRFEEYQSLAEQLSIPSLSSVDTFVENQILAKEKIALS